MSLRAIDCCTGLILFVLLITTSPLRAEGPDQGLVEQLPGLLEMLQERRLMNEKLNRRFENPMVAADEPLAAVPGSTQTPANQAFREGLRDPFTVTPQMLVKSGQQGGSELRFQASAGAQRLPMLKLRGIITRTKESMPLVLLEIGGRDVYMVSRGDEISFDPTQPGQVLKVKSIDRHSVVVEVGTVGDIMVVR